MRRCFYSTTCSHSSLVHKGALSECDKLLSTLRSSTQMLLEVIDDVLDLSKIESGMEFSLPQSDGLEKRHLG